MVQFICFPSLIEILELQYLNNCMHAALALDEKEPRREVKCTF